MKLNLPLHVVTLLLFTQSAPLVFPEQPVVESAIDRNRPTVPTIPESLVDEVGSLFPTAKKTSQWDFAKIESVDQAMQAQQRIREIGPLADWALVRLFERDKDSQTSLEALKFHMRSNNDPEQTKYALWVTRNAIAEAMNDPKKNALKYSTTLAAEYLSFWGDSNDLPLLESLLKARHQQGKETDRAIGSFAGRLSMRIARKLPPGETDIKPRPKVPFHQRGIKEGDIEGLKRLVEVTNSRSSKPD